MYKRYLLNIYASMPVVILGVAPSTLWHVARSLPCKSKKVWMTDFKANPSWIVPLRKHKSLYAEMHMFVFKQSKIYSIKGKSWEKLWGFFVPLKKKLPLRPLWLKAQITNTAMGMSKSLLLINTTFYYSNIETLKPNRPAVFCQT